jgi:hypothetical protein
MAPHTEVLDAEVMEDVSFSRRRGRKGRELATFSFLRAIQLMKSSKS